MLKITQEVHNMSMLSKYFSEKEFRCPGSGVLMVDPDLLKALDELREIMGEPVYVTSGCRSPEHNKKVGGSDNSYHVTTDLRPCMAADLLVKTGHHRYRMIEAAIRAGFGGIGVYSNHIHVDVRDDLVMWRG
jgi:uncharacterized protein YcbK (DUF882 family)